MIQKEFAHRAKTILAPDDNVIGLAVAGSWLSNEMDEFSDLDLILVTQEKVSGNQTLMLAYAKKLGHFLSGFTGEHVGEPRVLICLYDEPLLHVDIKFLTLAEFGTRVETPFLLLDKEGQLQKEIDQSTANFPYPDYQWIEDRFWIWIHYALLKIGRGEYLEALDFFGFLRMVVFGPLLLIHNKQLPRGVRKVETNLKPADLELLKRTIPQYSKLSLLSSLKDAIVLYEQLRTALFDKEIELQKVTEQRVRHYLEEVEKGDSGSC